MESKTSPTHTTLCCSELSIGSDQGHHHLRPLCPLHIPLALCHTCALINPGMCLPSWSLPSFALHFLKALWCSVEKELGEGGKPWQRNDYFVVLCLLSQSLYSLFHCYAVAMEKNTDSGVLKSSRKKDISKNFSEPRNRRQIAEFMSCCCCSQPLAPNPSPGLHFQLLVFKAVVKK